MAREEQEIGDALFKFHDALFNARLNSDLEDTGQSTLPQLHKHQDEFLTDLPKLAQGCHSQLIAKLSLEEVEECLKGMKNGKSPGKDGLPKELYLVLWEILGEDLVKVLQAILDKGVLPDSFKEGLTRLISKLPGQSVPELGELRPVTLLNTDYKLLSKSLTARARLVLPNVITSRQLAVPGQDIMEGVHCLLSALAFIEQRCRDGVSMGALLAMFDLFKAHDRVHIAYLDLVMEVMNFPTKFRSWIQTLHRGANTRLILPGGKLSQAIQINVSLRQGDPWAMTGFVIQFEPFLKALLKVVTGVTLGLPRPSMTPNPSSYTEKGPAFADDFLVLTTNPQDVLKVDQMSKRYEEQSGALLCRNKKSKVLFLGEWSSPGAKPKLPVHYLKEVEEARVFGFTIKPSLKETQTRSWEERIKKLRGKLIQWKTRNLPTLHQRSQAVSTYLSATLWYTAQVLALPKSFTQQINSEISRFIFRGRVSMGRLTLAELCHPARAGGLSLVDTRRKADSLLVKEACRMMTRGGPGYRHLSFWLGNGLRNLMVVDEGPKFLRRPPKPLYHLLKLLEEARTERSEKDLLSESAKSLYVSLCGDLPKPRLERRNQDQNMEMVWARLASPVLGVTSRHQLFLIANGLLRNGEDLFLKWGVGELVCNHSPDTEGVCAGQPESPVHLLQRCARVEAAWSWLFAFLNTLIPPGLLLEEQCLTIFYQKLPTGVMEDTVIWLLGSYYEYVIKEAMEKRRVVKEQELRGYLKQCLRAYKLRRLRPLHLPGL